MDGRPTEKKRRLLEVIRGLGLPDSGEALDFGCGVGEFTYVLRQALPQGWTVYGLDIIRTAVENARRWYPKCAFFMAQDERFKGKRFDFVLTHHVLEHVFDLPHVLSEISDRMKEQSAVLHVLPCGNAGSFEHDICLLRKDGIDPTLGNRFFFEDKGHIRRLTTSQLVDYVCRDGFVLQKEYYSGQYYGAINYFTQRSPHLIAGLTAPSAAKSRQAKKRLRRLRGVLFLLWALRYPAACVEAKIQQRAWRLRHYVVMASALPLYVFAKPMDAYLKQKALQEWNKRRTQRNGSAMYLFFKR